MPQKKVLLKSSELQVFILYGILLGLTILSVFESFSEEIDTESASLEQLKQEKQQYEESVRSDFALFLTISVPLIIPGTIYISILTEDEQKSFHRWGLIKKTNSKYFLTFGFLLWSLVLFTFLLFGVDYGDKLMDAIQDKQKEKIKHADCHELSVLYDEVPDMQEKIHERFTVKCT